MKITIYDKTNDGHHWFYNKSIIDKISSGNIITYCTEYISDVQINKLNKNGVAVEKFKKRQDNNSIIKAFNAINRCFNIIKNAKKNDAEKIILLYYDLLILGSIMFLISRYDIIATLHWLPTSKLKILIIKLLSRKKNFKLVVHEDLIKNDLIKYGVDESKIHVILYPIDEKTNNKKVSKLTAKKAIKIENNYKNILCFGGTRYDKGIDILLDSLKYINEPVNIIIAGKEQYFTRDFIEEKFEDVKNKHNLILNLKFISDEDMIMYFNVADFIVLPYRKDFMGQSGPLTEAIKYKKIVIASDWYIIGNTIKQYNCGILYKVEDAKDLGEKINYSIDEFENITEIVKDGQKKFIKDRSLNNFKSNYNKLLSE